MDGKRRKRKERRKRIGKEEAGKDLEAHLIKKNQREKLGFILKT